MGKSLPIIILCNPQLGENIGAVARAMSNFGLCKLRLVSPRDGWPNLKAYELSAHGSFVLDDLEVFDDLDAATADLTYLFATTAQSRFMVKPVVESHKMDHSVFNTNKVGFVFGRERSGLTNDEINICDSIINIPTSQLNPSLNLAQAVSIVSYEYSKLSLKDAHTDYPTLASKQEVTSFFSFLESALDENNFFKSPSMKPTMMQNIKNTFIRSSLTEQDVRTLFGIIKILSNRDNS